MKEKIQAMKDTEFRKKDILMIERVEDGFENHEHFILRGSQEAYHEFLKRAMALNGGGHSFFDFYYGQLEEEEKENFKKALGEKDTKFLEVIDWSGGIYFPLEEDILPFILKVTAQEILFSTFFFSKVPCTLWGNYRLQYPMFFKDKEGKEIYQNLATECGLEFE